MQRLVLTNTDCSAKSVQVLSDTLVNSLFVCNIHTLILDNNPVSQNSAGTCTDTEPEPTTHSPSAALMPVPAHLRVPLNPGPGSL